MQTVAEQLVADLNQYLYPPEWEAVLRNHPWSPLIDWSRMADADPLGWWRVVTFRDGTILAQRGTGRKKRWTIYLPDAEVHIFLSGEVVDLATLEPGHLETVRRLRELTGRENQGIVRQIVLDICRRVLLRAGEKVRRR